MSLSGTTAPATLTLSANSNALLPGSYTATFTVSSSLAGVLGSPRTITVYLSVSTEARPIIAFSSFKPLAFSVTRGATCPSTPPPPVFSVSNNGTGTLNGLAVTASYPSGQPSWLSATLSSTTAPATVNVQPSCAAYSLAPGTYTATVSVSSTASGVANSPQSVSASLVVAPATTPATGSLTVSATGIPAGSTASVQVESNLGRTSLSLVNGQSVTVTNLFPNEYNVVPYTMPVLLPLGWSTYVPSPVNRFVTVAAGSTASVSISYVLGTGFLRISANGIPSGCGVGYSYSGANQSGSGPLPSSGGVFAANVIAGTYTVTFGPPQTGSCVGTTLHAVPASVTVNVPAAQTVTQVTGTYVP